MKTAVWLFPFLGFNKIEIEESREEEFQLLKQFWKAIKEVEYKNEATLLDNFCKNYKGKAIVEDQVTHEKINLCDVSFDDICMVMENCPLPRYTENSYKSLSD